MFVCTRSDLPPILRRLVNCGSRLQWAWELSPPHAVNVKMSRMESDNATSQKDVSFDFFEPPSSSIRLSSPKSEHQHQRITPRTSQRGPIMELLSPRSILSGALFGAALTAAGVYSPTVIIKQMHFHDFHMMKAFFSAAASSAYVHFLPHQPLPS